MRIQKKNQKYIYRKEFIAQYAQKTGMSDSDAAAAAQAFLDTLYENWASGVSVGFNGFGVFELRPTSERMGRNPKTKQDAVIPAGYKPVFRVSDGLRAQVNQRMRQNGLL